LLLIATQILTSKMDFVDFELLQFRYLLCLQLILD